jgi:hypothetical protein
MSFVPVTPAGTPLTGLAANTFKEAKRRLLKDASYMPYEGWEEFEARGYTIENCPTVPAQNPPQWYSRTYNFMRGE